MSSSSWCTCPVNRSCFLRDVLAPYLNYHRPCHFPVETTDSKGRTRKRYPFENVTTPYLKLKSLDGAQRYLRPGVTFEQLDSVAVALVRSVRDGHWLAPVDAVFTTNHLTGSLPFSLPPAPVRLSNL